ncbi:MAG TPA: TonB-dependent receptor [Pyrinomonadaceae bacterium]|jgi:outer membrane receptor protein involved in Fe transport
MSFSNNRTGRLSSARTFALLLALVSSIFACSEARAQAQQLEGVVIDQTGAPVAGAQVLIRMRAEAQFATTDAEGKFRLAAAPTGEATILVSANGFAPNEAKIKDAVAASGQLRIVLVPASLSEAVTVTATRTETRLNDVAGSLVVLSSREVAEAGAATIDDALRQVPGFTLFRRTGSRAANPTTQGVSLRGIGPSGASRALVLVDGVPLNDPFGGWVYWGRVPRESIDRIEVLRGGASSLYGSSALGGVVNLITRQPAANALSLEASYGSLETGEASLFAAGGRGKWSASAAAEVFSTEGYILVDERERGRVDTPAGVRRTTLDLSLSREIKGRGRLFLRGSVFGEARTNGTPLQINRTHTRQLSAGLDWRRTDAGAFTLRAYGGTQVYDQTFSAVSADRSSETLTRLQRSPSQFKGLSLQWSRGFGSHQTLVAGVDAQEVRGESDEIVYTLGRAASLSNAGGRQSNLGLFVEDLINLSPRLLFRVGVRVDRWRNSDAFQFAQPLAAGASSNTSIFPDRTETAFSPQVSALYRLTNQLSLNASFYRAFRAPTLNELYRSFRVGDVLTLANEGLSAERLTGGEAGGRASLFSDRLSTQATVFWMEVARPVANVTLRTQPGLITRQRENLGRTRSRGLEFEADARLSNNWTLSGGYLFVDATVLEFPANTGLEGKRVPQVARHQLTFQARYSKESLLTAAFQGRASSTQFDDDQNLLQLEPYFTLDAFLSRRITRNLEAFLAAENLFNQRYTVGRTPIRTIGPPLLFRVGFRLRTGSR